MVRMSRSRWNDPVNRSAARERHGPTHGGLWEPSLGHVAEARGDGDAVGTGRHRGTGRGESGEGATEDDADVNMALPMDVLAEAVPASDERRKVLARDPLAGVDGFRVIVGLVFEYILGMRYCPRCPD